jgi:hypothetical protein
MAEPGHSGVGGAEINAECAGGEGGHEGIDRSRR